MKTNTELCIDLKTNLFKDVLMELGKDYPGVLTRDAEDHYLFIETVPSTSGKRNPHVYEGKFITLTRRDDGSVRPNFRPILIGANKEAYILGVCNELVEALKAL